MNLGEDPVHLKGTAEGIELLGFEFRHRQPQLARVSAQQLHRTLDRDRVGGQR